MKADINAISSALAKDENLEWASGPEPFEPVDRYNKKPLLRRWILCCVIGVALIIIYCVAVFRSDAAAFSIVIPVVIAFVAIYIAILPLLDARLLMRKKTFVLTNKRAILYESDSNQKSFPFEIMDAVRIIHKEGGLCDVLFGSPAIKRPYYKVRLTALIPKEKIKDDDSVVRGMAFYNVTGADRIKSLIPEGIPVEETELSEKI